MSDEYKIQTKEQAYEVAVRVTGFEKETFRFDSLTINDIILDTIFDDNIPFWVPEDSGTPVWVVTFDELKYEPEKVNKKTYKVYLKAKTKQLIKIIGQEDISKDFFFDEFSKESLKKKLYSTNLEEWVSFPESIRCSLDQALGRAVPRPFPAKEIYAVCVNMKDSSNDSRLVWIVICSGRPKDNILPSNRIILIMNGNSGHAISAGTF